MTSTQMGLQESFRWIIRSVVLVCGISLTLVFLWQVTRWWSHNRTLGKVDEVVCLAVEGRELPQDYWKNYFSYWLLPHQSIQLYQLKAFEDQLLSTGYFQKVQITFEDSRLFARYQLNEPLAIVGEKQLCLYEEGNVLPALLSLEEDMIRLVGISSLNETWNLETVKHFASFLKLLKNEPLFKGCILDATDWRFASDPSSEVVVQLQKTRTLWFRLGSVHFKKPDDLIKKLIHAYVLLEHRAATVADLRIESVVVLGHEKQGKK